MGIRKNQACLTDEEKTAFVDAVQALKSNGTYKPYIDVHRIHFSHPIHQSAMFLPWHREFLHRFELELQNINPDVSIPYWDWTVDNSITSSLWRSNFMGAFTELHRTLGASPFLPTRDQVIEAIHKTPYDSAPWRHITDGFRSKLEELHNGPHNWVGGAMAGAGSPEDPIFWLHHSNIDRLWAIWQREHPSATYLPPSGTPGANGMGLDDPMHEFREGETNTLTPRDVLDHTTLGYEYDNYSLNPINC
ncbi:tyrosinase family protein [Paenibacillus alvei]|uniref:tyrosinase family protein n=1 Tax=Paenibacillus alvei TaxID=44250 RepID=UPI003D2A07E5